MQEIACAVVSGTSIVLASIAWLFECLTLTNASRTICVGFVYGAGAGNQGGSQATSEAGCAFSFEQAGLIHHESTRKTRFTIEALS